MDSFFDRTKLPSRHVTERTARGPHRSYPCVMDLTCDQIHRPAVGSAMICQAQGRKKGVDSAAANPREFCAVTGTDAVAAPSSHEVSASSIELTTCGHSNKALVSLVASDKSLPGMMLEICPNLRTVNENLRKVVWNRDQDIIWLAGKRAAAIKGMIDLQLGDAELEKRKKIGGYIKLITVLARYGVKQR